jgi:hypothetical protein
MSEDHIELDDIGRREDDGAAGGDDETSFTVEEGPDYTPAHNPDTTGVLGGNRSRETVENAMHVTMIW